MIFVVQKQIDMSDSDNPIQKVRKPYFLEIGGEPLEYIFELAPNEFVDYNDSLGLFR